MKIGIDIDDTITDSYDIITSTFCHVYNVNKYDIINNKLSYEALKKIFPFYFDFTKKAFMEIIPHARLKNHVCEVINELHNLGYTIEFVTARNNTEYDNPYQISLNYLKKHNIYFDHLYVGVQDKGIFCKENNIDILIDDSKENLELANKYGIKTILFNNIFNEDTPKFTSASSWLEILNILKKIDFN